MFKKQKQKDKEIDITSLNIILKTSKKLITILFFMAIICLILLGTYLLKEWKIFTIIKDILIVISPIFIGLLIAWLFDPFVKKLQNKKIPRLLGCFIAYIILLGIIFGISYLFIPSLIGQVKDFISAAPKTFEQLTNVALNLIEKLDINDVIDSNQIKKEIMNIITTYGMTIISDLPKYVISISKGIISGGLNFVLGLMIGFYLLYDFNKVNDKILSFMPNKWEKNYLELTNRINNSLRDYIQGVLLVMLLVFLTQTVGLTLAGLEAPIVFALFCAVTDIIPYFGPYIGGIPAVIVGFTMSPITGICVLISIVIVQLLENNFYQPLIMGHQMKLHPVSIMIGLLIFEHFFGILGMVIATPVIACLKVFIEFINEKLNILEKVNGEEIVEENEKIKAKELINVKL